jgi:hypothetical protein
MDTVVKVQGFFRVNVVDPDGTLKGDSGWQENKVVNEGFNHYLVELMLAQANSLRVSHIALGTSATAVADTDTALAGELEKRQAVTASSIASKTAQFVATFASTLSFVTDATRQLNNIGLFAYSSKGSGSMFAGNTFSSSQIASNQNVNVTYQIRFATA